MSFFELMFGGEIYPAEDYVPKTAEYKLMKHKLSEAAEALCAVLTDEQKQLFQTYQDARADESIAVDREIFKRSFILGMQFQKELNEFDRLPDKE